MKYITVTPNLFTFWSCWWISDRNVFLPVTNTHRLCQTGVLRPYCGAGIVSDGNTMVLWCILLYCIIIIFIQHSCFNGITIMERPENMVLPWYNEQKPCKPYAQSVQHWICSVVSRVSVDKTRFCISKHSMFMSLSHVVPFTETTKSWPETGQFANIEALWQTAIGLSRSCLPSPTEATRPSVSFGGLHVLCL